jgi:ParB family chromosome partitioning protein
MKRKALGKGLRALIPEVETPAGREKYLEIELSKIIPSGFQPRERIDQEKLISLVRSIKSRGILQPILVRPSEDKFQLIAGERRFRAAIQAGFEKIPAVVIEIPDEQLLEVALIENVQRENLNPIEEAEAYQKLMQKFDYTQEEIADKVGKDRSSIANYLRLLTLPDKVKALVSDGRLSMGHAKAILGSDDPFQQEYLAKVTVNRKLSVRELEKFVAKKTGKKTVIPLPAEEDIFTKEAENKLTQYLGTRLSIRHLKKGGKLEIYYSSEEDLQRIYEMILPPDMLNQN